MSGWVEKSYDRCIRGTYYLLLYYYIYELFTQFPLQNSLFNIYIFTLINKDPLPTFALTLMNYVIFDA